MAQSVKLVGLIALLFLGAGGWGATGVAALCRLGWADARREIGPPLQVLLGVAIFLAAGGFLVALGIAQFAVLLAWHLVGVGLLAIRAAGIVRRRPALAPRSVLLGVGAAVVGAVVAMIAVASAIGHPSFHPFDDDAAYIYLAKRLSATGGMIDPFNLRRLTSYGGSTLYESMFFRVTGNASLRAFDFVFAGLLLVAVVVESTRRHWFLLGLLAVGVVVTLGFGLGMVVNLSPEFSVVAFSVGLYQLLGKVRSRRREGGDQRLLYVVIGFFMAAILALRFTDLITVVIATFMVLLILQGRHCLRPLAIVVGTGIVVSLGWATALARSSGTPLYPLVSGNADPSWPSGRDPHVTRPSQYWHLFLSAFNGDGMGRVAVAAIVIAVIVLAFTDVAPKRPLVLLCVGVATIVRMGVITYDFTGSSLDEITRFNGPATLACGLLAIDTLWPRRSAGGLPVLTRRWARPRASAGARAPALSRSAFGAVTFVLATAMIAMIDGASPVAAATTVKTMVTSAKRELPAGFDVLRGAPAVGFEDRYALLRPEYARLNRVIPPGARVLAAVDDPVLLDPTRYWFATLDNAGAASPAPHLPFFTGSAAKVRYLRGQGIRYILADESRDFGLFQRTYRLRTALIGAGYHARIWAPYVIDWQGTVTSLEEASPSAVRRVGSLVLIRI